MHRVKVWALLMGVFVLGGCRAATSIKELPRVDLQVETAGGNRGYLIGTPPAASDLKTHRQMFGLDIEVPTFARLTPGEAPPEGMSEEGMMGEESAETIDEAAMEYQGPYDTYVVQKGDSLWSIAAKPEIYGKATQWRRIFDANRDMLKNPGQLRAGMTLRIPRGEGEEPASYGKDAEYRK
jgi:nucleoid-associated protein YgaU